MANDSGGQSNLTNIGLAVVAVLAAATAARTFSIEDTRPLQPELGRAATAGAVVHAQLWQDPFQAVDLYFKNSKIHKFVPGDQATAPSWLKSQYDQEIKTIDNDISKPDAAAPAKVRSALVFVDKQFYLERQILANGAEGGQNEIGGALLYNGSKLASELRALSPLVPAIEAESEALQPFNKNSPLPLANLVSEWLASLSKIRADDTNTLPGIDLRAITDRLTEAHQLVTNGLQLRETFLEARLRAAAELATNLEHTPRPAAVGKSKSKKITGAQLPTEEKTPQTLTDAATRLERFATQIQADEWQLARITSVPGTPGADLVEAAKIDGQMLRLPAPPDVHPNSQELLTEANDLITELASRNDYLIDQIGQEAESAEIRKEQRDKRANIEAAPGSPEHSASANECAQRSEPESFDLPPNECLKSGLDAAALNSDYPKIIAAMVNDGSIERDTELRQRQRYGIVTALEASGYMPEEPDQIHITQLASLICGYRQNEDSENQNSVPDPNDEQKFCAAAKSRPCGPDDQRGCVPFERFMLRSDGGLKQRRHKEILLLWLRDADIFHLENGKSLDILLSVAKNVYPQDRYHESSLAVLGPPNSASLQLLYNRSLNRDFSRHLSIDPCSTSNPKDVSISPCATGESPHPGLHLFDAHATKALPIELGEPANFNSDPLVLEKYRFPECIPRNQGFCFSRTGVPDTDLARSLAQELKRRGLNDRAFRTVLLVDGQSALTLSLHNQLINNLRAEMASGPGALPEDILSYFYFPGVDGQLTGDFSEPDWQSSTGKPAQVPPNTQHSPGQATGGSAPAAAKTDISEARDSSAGAAQIDYFYRLGRALKARNADKPIGAIGIVSNDVYDALDIVQTLRPIFPHALMFTSFLYAQMTDRGMLNNTKGLVVASKFGLDADPLSADIGGTPEFRDQFSTADFLTTLYVTQCDVDDPDLAENLPLFNLCNKLKVIVNPNVPPTIFGIGRTGATYRLTKPQESVSRQPDASLSPADRVLLWIASIAAFGGIHLANRRAAGWPSSASQQASPLECCYPHKHATLRWCQKLTWKFWATASSVTLVTAAMCFWPAIDDVLTEHGEGEPLGWADGISLWPTVWIQLADFALASWFVFLIIRMLNQSAVRLGKKFHLGNTGYDTDEQTEATVRAALHAITFIKPFDFRRPNAPQSPTAGIKLYWDHYLQRCSIIARVERSLAITLAAALPIWFFSWLYPNDPLLARGAVVRNFYLCSAFLCTTMMIFLAALVFDATVNSVRFVWLTKIARRADCEWPEPTTRSYIEGLGFKSQCIPEWIDLQFTSLRTTVILRLVWFPFVVLGLFIVAKGLVGRAEEGGVLTAVAIASAMLITSVAALRVAAENQRGDALRKFRKCLSRISGDMADAKDGNATREQIGCLIDRTEALDEGAFASALNQPLVKAIFVPIGAGVWPLVSQKLGL